MNRDEYNVDIQLGVKNILAKHSDQTIIAKKQDFGGKTKKDDSDEDFPRRNRQIIHINQYRSLFCEKLTR